MTNFGLLFCFVTLATTGVMAFLLPFSINTTRVHIIFGLMTMILVGLHLASRLKYFQSQVVGKGRSKTPQWLLAVLAVGWAALLAISIAGSSPVGVLIRRGYEARHRDIKTNNVML